MVRNPSISQISLCWIPRVSWPVHIQEKKTLYSMLWLETANNQALGNFTPWIPVKVQVQRHLFASLLCFLCSLIAIYCLLKGGCIDSVYLLVHRWNLFKVIEFNDRLKLYRYKHLRLEKKREIVQNFIVNISFGFELSLVALVAFYFRIFMSGIHTTSLR